MFNPEFEFRLLAECVVKVVRDDLTNICSDGLQSIELRIRDRHSDTLPERSNVVVEYGKHVVH